MPRIVAYIPVRMAASRFPGKPLADILGLPMVEHVRRRVARCKLVDEIVIATCDEEIRERMVGFGARVVMTSHRHERCTDRIAEAAREVPAEIAINVQGDEPFVDPESLDKLVAPLLHDAAGALPCTNLMSPITSLTAWRDPNVVKTVVDPRLRALYFSREPIPSMAKAGGKEFARYRQLGIIAFRGPFLQEFTQLPPTPLEQVESVDMMRAVEHGYPVQMVVVTGPSIGVDTPADLERAREMMRADALYPQYAGSAR
jgi:3-deoxy-manno-octulosonate cytidylyltransferase (CMP-KDO synthetase)